MDGLTYRWFDDGAVALSDCRLKRFLSHAFHLRSLSHLPGRGGLECALVSALLR